MGSANREDTPASSLDLLNGWLASDEREPGLAVIEDFAQAALPALMNTSRQSDPAAPPPSPEDGGDSDARGPAGAAQAAPVTASSLPGAGVDLSVDSGSGRVVGFLLFAAAVVTVIEAAVAYADPGPATLGLTALLALVTLGTWRSRGRHPRATVLLDGTRLEIVRDGGRHVFDLADIRSQVDVVGLPGDRTWRVLFHRRGLAPYVLDATMVDPAEFLRLLHTHRAEVHYRPR